MIEDKVIPILPLKKLHIIYNIIEKEIENNNEYISPEEKNSPVADTLNRVSIKNRETIK
jgi:hypothetical protein